MRIGVEEHRPSLLDFSVRIDGAVVVDLRASAIASVSTGLSALLLIELAEDGVDLLAHFFHLGLDGLGVAAFLDLLQFVDLMLDGFLVLRRELVAVFTQLLLHLVDHGIGMVDGFDFFLVLLVLLGVLLGFLHALVDLVFRHVGGSGDGDLLLVAGALVLGADVYDTVAVDELEGRNFGDNDTLSAIVASIINADVLMILTDIDGVYDKNPKAYPDAKRLSVIEKIDDEVRAMAGGAGSARGTGGMATKIRAAEIAGRANIPTYILSGEDPENLYRIFDGEDIGTVFMP